MTFENSTSVIRIQMQKRIFALFVGVPVALFYATDLGNYLYNLTGIPRQILSFSLLGLYLLFYFYHILSKSAYVYYSDEQGKVIIRFYLLNPFDSKKNSYEIPKSQFAKFEVKKSLLNLREEILIYRKMGASIAQYPPFSISTLNKNERHKLLKSLHSLSPNSK